MTELFAGFLELYNRQPNQDREAIRVMYSAYREEGKRPDDAMGLALTDFGLLPDRRLSMEEGAAEYEEIMLVQDIVL